MSDTKKAKVVRDFKDSGTEQTYTAGAVIDLTEGQLTNYVAAGLVEAVAPESKAATKAT